MQIPKQLQNYRFIKTHRKNPKECGWPIDPVRHIQNADGSYTDKLTGLIYKSKGQVYKGKIRSYTFDEMNEVIQDQESSKMHTVTYGVLGGYNGLVIIDIDSKAVLDRIKDVWPFNDTFTTLSGTKQLPHFYLKCEEYSENCFYDTANKRAIDVQARSKFVVGPNSYVKSNNNTVVYNISNDVPIVEISYKNLIKILEENLGDDYKFQKKQENIYTGDYFIIDPIAQAIFNKISCTQVLHDAGIDVSSNPGDTPFAESEGKKCLHRTEHLWYDHHTQTGGNVITLYSKIHNLDSIKAKYDLAEQAGVTKEIYAQAINFFVKNQQHEMTELLALKFMASTPTHTLRIDKQRGNEIYIYKDGLYIPNGESYIKEFCDDILGKWYTTGLVGKIVDKIAIRTKIDPDEFFKEADPELLPVQNGILNIITRKLYDFNPGFRFFNKLPVTYNCNATCETTVKHFNTILNGPQDIALMQELYGYLLLRTYKFEKAFMFYGNGRNGKTKTIEQMKALIGEHNSINLSLQQLQNEKYLRGELHGKLANLADDIGNGDLEETQIFKELTGGSTITVDRKHLSSISFKSYAKMIFSANKLPAISEDTDAIWSRWKLIGFTKKFCPKPEYEALETKGKLKPHFRVADEEILNKLTTPVELSGVLNWALDGLNRLITSQGFSRPDSHDEVRALWRRNTSLTVQFLQDRITVTYHPDDYERDEKLYQAYVEYCINLKTIAETEQIFRKKLREENIICRRKNTGHGMEWRWQGIRLEEK